MTLSRNMLLIELRLATLHLDINVPRARSVPVCMWRRARYSLPRSICHLSKLQDESILRHCDGHLPPSSWSSRFVNQLSVVSTGVSFPQVFCNMPTLTAPIVHLWCSEFTGKEGGRELEAYDRGNEAKRWE